MVIRCKKCGSEELNGLCEAILPMPGENSPPSYRMISVCILCGSEEMKEIEYHLSEEDKRWFAFFDILALFAISVFVLGALYVLWKITGWVW